MVMFSIVCACGVALVMLLAIAGAVCFVGTQTDKMGYVMLAMFMGFFLGYIILDFTLSMLTDVLNLPPFFWEWTKGGA